MSDKATAFFSTVLQADVDPATRTYRWRTKPGAFEPARVMVTPGTKVPDFVPQNFADLAALCGLASK